MRTSLVSLSLVTLLAAGCSEQRTPVGPDSLGSDPSFSVATADANWAFSFHDETAPNLIGVDAFNYNVEGGTKTEGTGAFEVSRTRGTLLVTGGSGSPCGTGEFTVTGDATIKGRTSGFTLEVTKQPEGTPDVAVLTMNGTSHTFGQGSLDVRCYS